MQFISSKAKVKAFFEGESIVLGPSTIRTKSLIGRSVIVGYPSKKKIEAFLFSKDFSIEKLDQISVGAKIGNNCIVRSGTVIYENVTIGDLVETGHNVLIREGSTIGNKSRIGSSAQLDGKVKIGRNVNVQSNAYLPHLTVIEDDVFIAPNVVFTNDLYPPSRRCTGIIVEKGATIGANACIVVPAKIGEGSVVGAGSLVTRDVPPGMVAMGVPAKPRMNAGEYMRKKAKWEKGVKQS